MRSAASSRPPPAMISLAIKVVTTSESVVAEPFAPTSSASSGVFTRLPLWPSATAWAPSVLKTGWAFSHVVDPVVEIAILEAKPGQAEAMREGLVRARAVISRAKGYRGSVFQQSIEKPERIVLYITWDSVADHTDGFRKGPLFLEWRAHWGEHLTGTPVVLHYDVFAGEA